jgi:hypothetical protein
MAISPGHRLTTFISDLKRISHSSLRKEIDLLGKGYRDWLSANVVGINKYTNTLDASLRKDNEIESLKEQIRLLKTQLIFGRKDDKDNTRIECGDSQAQGQVGTTEGKTPERN